MTNDYLLKTIKNVREMLEKGVLEVTTEEGYFDTHSRFRAAGGVLYLARHRVAGDDNPPLCGACALGALLLGQPREPDEKPFDWEDLDHLGDVTGARMYLKGLNLLPGTLDKMELMFMTPEVSSKEYLTNYLYNLPTIKDLTREELEPYKTYFPEDCPPRVRLEVLLMQLEQTGTVSVDKPWNSYIAVGLCGRKLLRWRCICTWTLL